MGGCPVERTFARERGLTSGVHAGGPGLSACAGRWGFPAGLFVLKSDFLVEELFCEHRLSAKPLTPCGQMAVYGAHARVHQKTDVTQQCHVCQKPGMTAPRAVLSQSGVAPVMVAILHPSPMRSTQVNPALGTAFAPFLARKVMPFLDARFPAFLLGAGAPDLHYNPAPCKARAQRFRRFEADFPLFNPAVPDAGLDKKGDACGPACAI